MADELSMHGHHRLAEVLILDHLSRYDPDRDTLNERAAYWLEASGRPAAAEERLETELERDPESRLPFGRLERVLTQLGVLAARCGDRERALRFSGRLRELGDVATRTFHKGFYTFFRARIAAALGENEEAMRLLRQARDLGAWGQVELHRYSWWPQSLRDYPAFQEFVRPKG